MSEVQVISIGPIRNVDDLRYRSAHDAPSLLKLASTIRSLEARECRVICDNTAEGHSFENALELQELTVPRD